MEEFDMMTYYFQNLNKFEKIEQFYKQNKNKHIVILDKSKKLIHGILINIDNDDKIKRGFSSCLYLKTIEYDENENILRIKDNAHIYLSLIEQIMVLE